MAEDDLRALGEIEVVERLRAWSGATGPGDDAAVLREDLCVTTDVLVEGLHFRLDWSLPGDVGWKAVAANVSDLAAMGAQPRWLTLGLGVSPSTGGRMLRRVYDGMREACAEYGCRLVGGDTFAHERLLLAVTAIGELDGPPMTRSGARPGDRLAVTGPLGLAAAGIAALRDGRDAPECVAAHRRPRARVHEGLALRGAGAHAAMDLSDGLWIDVRRLAAASGVGVDIDHVPVADAASRLGMSDVEAGSGGEDYELLVAVPPGFESPVALLPVGHVVAEGLRYRGAALPHGGFDHFASG